MSPMLKYWNKENGTALIITLCLLLMITLLGLSTFNRSIGELQIAANDTAWLEAQYLAESGIALLLQWFQDPKTLPDIGTFPNGYASSDRARFLKKRQRDVRGFPSFFDARGRNQFTGTKEEPDFLYQAKTDGPILTGEIWKTMGELTSLKVFSPTTPGAMSTVEAVGTARSGIRRTVNVQLVSDVIPSMTAAVQSGMGSDGSVPILVHWGDVRVMGHADLGDSLESIPKKHPFADVSGTPYISSDRQDPWLDFDVGRTVIRPQSAGCPGCPEPFLSEGYSNIHQFQDQIQAGFRLDAWNDSRLKVLAKERGTYYATDTDGNLYLDGIKDATHRKTPSQALASSAIGNRRDLVFIDTINGNPPTATNMATLHISLNDAQGLFFIYAHVILQESGPGRSIQVMSPPPEGSETLSERQSVTLSNIHLNGVLSVTGRITVEGHPMIFGAILARQGFNGSGQPEVWYDHDLLWGYYSGLPAVTILKGSWAIN